MKKTIDETKKVNPDTINVVATILKIITPHFEL
jgi:hypothetical protein